MLWGHIVGIWGSVEKMGWFWRCGEEDGIWCKHSQGEIELITWLLEGNIYPEALSSHPRVFWVSQFGFPGASSPSTCVPEDSHIAHAPSFTSACPLVPSNASFCPPLPRCPFFGILSPWNHSALKSFQSFSETKVCLWEIPFVSALAMLKFSFFLVILAILVGSFS